MPLSSTHNVYYVPPPDQAPNLFASFTSQFLRTRTPWAQDLLARRLDAMDPTKKAASLAALDQQRAAILEQGQAWRKSQFDSIDNAMKQWRDVVQQESGVLKETISAKRSVATANAVTARMFEQSSMSSQKDIQALNETLVALESRKDELSNILEITRWEPDVEQHTEEIGGVTKQGETVLKSDQQYSELSNKADALIRKLSNEDLPPGELADNTSELARMAGLGPDVQQRIREQAGGIGDIAVAKRRRIPGMVGLGTIDRSAQHENALAQLEKLEAQRSWLLQQPMSPEVQQALGQLENSRRRVEFEFDNPLIGRPGDAFIRTEASQRKMDELRAARLQALQQPVEIDRGTSFEYTPVLQTVQPGQPPGQPRGPGGGGRQPAGRQQARREAAPGQMDQYGESLLTEEERGLTPDPTVTSPAPEDTQQLGALADYFPAYVTKAAGAAAPVLGAIGQGLGAAYQANLDYQKGWLPPVALDAGSALKEEMGQTFSKEEGRRRLQELVQDREMVGQALGAGQQATLGQLPTGGEVVKGATQAWMTPERASRMGSTVRRSRPAPSRKDQLLSQFAPEHRAAIEQALASGDVTLEAIEQSYGGPR